MKWPVVLLSLCLACCSSEPVNTEIGEIAKNKDILVPMVTTNIQARKFSKGEALYLRNCADCHGWEGKGNGPAVEYMDVPTPVLQHSAILAKQSENQFVDWVLYGLVPKLKGNENTGPQTGYEFNLLISYIRKLNSIDWDEVAIGQEIYDELCANCHGLYGHGDGAFSSQMPVPLPDLSAASYQSQHSDADLQHIISQGKNAMPGVADVLSAEEIKAVTAFIRLFSPGYESYDRYCASCHGSDGLPMEFVVPDENQLSIAFENVTIPSFDTIYLETHTDKQLAARVQHMMEDNRVTMLHFAEGLEENEVRLIYQYLHQFINNPAKHN